MSKQVLVVDDNSQVRAMLRENLKDMGYEVNEACDGLDALQVLRTSALPDLVITDIIMPRMMGFDMIVQIKSRYPSVKLLTISGGGGKEIGSNLNRARRLGSDCVLAKPFKMEELEKMVVSLA